jgi:hypothetical protein
MHPQYTTCPLNKQARGANRQRSWGKRREQFLHPLVVCLDLVLDRRLVRTFVQTVITILVHRARQHGMVAVRVGRGVALSRSRPRRNKARLSNLFLSPKWSSLVIDVFLWKRAEAFVKRLQEAGQPILADVGRVVSWRNRRVWPPKDGCRGDAPARQSGSNASSPAFLIRQEGGPSVCPVSIGWG